VTDPADVVELRVSRAQAQLLLEAVQEYAFDLVHHQLPPVRGLRRRRAQEAERQRWVAERQAAMEPLLELLKPFGR